MLNTTILNQSVQPQTGFAVGGVLGYDFVGPRVEVETVYRYNSNNANFGGTALQNQVNQLGVLANVLYDFNAGGTIVPYIGALAPVLPSIDGNNSFGSTQFAYQGIIGVGYNINDTWRVNLDGRYYGTTNPQVNGFGNNQQNFNSSWNNNNFSIMLGLQVKFGATAVALVGTAAADDDPGAELHGVLRLGPLEPVGSGLGHDRPGRQRLQDQG